MYKNCLDNRQRTLYYGSTMKNTQMSLSEFRMKINTALLKRIGAGEEAITITSHGFPVARVGAINPAWDGRPFLDPVPTPAPGEPIQGHDTSTTNTFTTSGDASITLEEAVTRQVPPPGYLTEEDLKAAQEVEHEDTVSSEQAKKELGLDEDAADVKTAQEALAEPGRRPWSEVREELDLEIPSRESLDRRYENNLKNLPLEMLEIALANTPPEETVGRAMLMTCIRNHRSFTATETEIYRQLMAQLRPPPSDDGT